MNSKNNRKSETDKLSVKIRLGMLLVIGTLLFLIAVSVVGAGKNISVCEEDSITRSDIINIDKMKIFGDLQESDVKFYHDLHTDALVKENEDCLICHKSVENKLVPKFMRVADNDKQEVMEIYHYNCIRCHEDTKGKTGPIVCRDCHTKKDKMVSSRHPIALDNSLHFRHTDFLENKCERCHHEYDKNTQKLIYVKGKEGSCRYCHKKEKEDNRISMGEAAHDSCLVCHLEMTEKKQTTGPVKCGGCHDLKKQKLIQKDVNPQRINRKQPDFVMIKTGNNDLDSLLKNRMSLVPFNHKEHEQSNSSCRACHHKALSSCSSCHSVEGKKEGGYVNLENAMHKPTATQSCTGCHEIKKQAKDCLGCHAFIAGNNKEDETSCGVCHIKIPESLKGEEMDKDMAMKLLATRSPIPAMFTNTDIPEKVVISKLANIYKPSEFPHRKIVNTLVEKIKNNKLASSFHNEEDLICKGCHHNLPITKKPSGCSTCHEASVKKVSTIKPGLKAAYHIQCMECHDNMNIGKTGCTDCHDKK